MTAQNMTAQNMTTQNMTTQSRRRIPIHSILALAGIVLAATFAAAPTLAQKCDNLSYRLWMKDAESWHRMGETVEIVTGEEGHIYLHVDSPSRNPYGTSAKYGAPREMGLGGPRVAEVRAHVQMRQIDDDRAAGRLRIEAAQPGETSIAFRIQSVHSPGNLDLVRKACRVGTIPIRVLPRGGAGVPGAQGSESERAARELASRLYTALLRRSEPNPDPSFVRDIARSGREGVLQVADVMVSSPEFRRDALRRTEEKHGRNSLDTLRRQLLADVYRDLYGYSDPDRDTQRDDLRDLEHCLGRDYSGDQACSRLGRELVGRSQFYDQHKALIDALGSGRPGRR